MENNELIKKRIRLLPESLKTFVLNDGWRLELNGICNEFGLNEEECTLIENETFLVLLGFEPFEDLKNNIKEVIRIDSNTTDDLLEEIKNKIFKQNEEYLDRLWEVIENMEEEEATNSKLEIKKPNPLGKSFEETILNQARGMMPAREEGEQNLEARSLSPGAENQGRVGMPENLPTEENQNNKTNVSVPNYSGGNDPYREPTE